MTTFGERRCDRQGYALHTAKLLPRCRISLADTRAPPDRSPLMPSQQDPLRPYTRYVAVSAAVAGALILVLMPLASALHRQWARHDVEAHSRAVFDSVREVVSHQITDGGAASLAALFERLTQEEKLLAIGYCDQAGQLRLPTKQMPANFSCAQLARTDTASYSTIESDARPVLVGSFPLQDGPDKGYLAILHDPSFLEARASEAPWNWALGIGGVGVGIGALAAFLGVPYLRQLRRARRRTTATRRAGGLSPRLNSNAS